MNKKYLLSGHTSTGELKDIDRMILEESDNQNIFILNLSSNDINKLRGKRDFFKEYFKELGAKNVECYSGDKFINFFEACEKASILYLPGGDTETLVERIGKEGIGHHIVHFDGIVAGNSAGAYLLCPLYLKIRKNQLEKTIPMMRQVNLWMKAHYEPKFDSALEDLSRNRAVYALENVSAIGVDSKFNVNDELKDSDLEFTGNIWKFSEGEKEKVN
jgi:hypothetical protein